MYIALIEAIEIDTSYDIYNGSKQDYEYDHLAEHFKNFTDAKRHVLADIDQQIAHLRARRRYIRSMRKADAWTGLENKTGEK